MRFSLRSALSVALVLLAVGLATGCRRLHRTDTTPLDQAGMWFNRIEELRALDVTDAEVAELVKVRSAGVSDGACVELVRLARSRAQPFAGGDAIASLRQVGIGEPAILELAKLNQLGLWVGEAQAMRLAGLSENVLLTLARRRAAGQPALSGPSVAQLKNSGLSEAQLLELINRAATDEQAAELVVARQRAANPTGFVRQRGRRR